MSGNARSEKGKDSSTVPEIFTESLLQERNLLHLILYRNKNQHRPSVWFKWLRMLKRDIEKLLVASGELLPRQMRKATMTTKIKLGGKGKMKSHRSSTKSNDKNNNDNKSKVKNKSNDKVGKTKVQETKGKQGEAAPIVEDSVYNEVEFKTRIAHLWNVIIPGCHLAFTHVITSTQFASLGMVLLAILARVHSLLAQHFPKETTEIVQGEAKRLPVTDDDAALSDGDDPMGEYGEAVDRESITVQIRQEAETTVRNQEDQEETKPIVLDSEPVNAIDDLFDNLF